VEKPDSPIYLMHEWFEDEPKVHVRDLWAEMAINHYFAFPGWTATTTATTVQWDNTGITIRPGVLTTRNY
jgi:uncharacterized protein YcnI